jgi:predicted DNA-binding transcriptional regulator YafY
VAFCEEFSGFIRDRIWSDGQEIIDLPDGGVELRFMVADENEFLGWVISFGNGAELIEPEYLRKCLLEEAQELVECYTPVGG